MRFRTTIQQTGNGPTGIEVPADVMAQLGPAKRYPVTVTVGAHTYRSSVSWYKGAFMISLSAENRKAAGVNGGDEVDVEIEHDTAPRDVEQPDDFAAALAAAPAAKALYETLSFSKKRALVDPIGQAKTPETRRRRLDKAIENLLAGTV